MGGNRMKCVKCGLEMLQYNSESNFDDKGMEIERFEYYICQCGYEDVKYRDREKERKHES